ncbi:hypothetical protein [Clavibacter zhangzhiyongii]
MVYGVGDQLLGLRPVAGDGGTFDPAVARPRPRQPRRSRRATTS